MTPEKWTKQELMKFINDIIKERRLTQEQAAMILKIDQPKVSLLSQGKVMGFSFARLFRLLNLLGRDITITMSKASEGHKPKMRAMKDYYHD